MKLRNENRADEYQALINTRPWYSECYPTWYIRCADKMETPR